MVRLFAVALTVLGSFAMLTYCGTSSATETDAGSGGANQTEGTTAEVQSPSSVGTIAVPETEEVRITLTTDEGIVEEGDVLEVTIDLEEPYTEQFTGILSLSSVSGGLEHWSRRNRSFTIARGGTSASVKFNSVSNDTVEGERTYQISASSGTIGVTIANEDERLLVGIKGDVSVSLEADERTIAEGEAFEITVTTENHRSESFKGSLSINGDSEDLRYFTKTDKPFEIPTGTFTTSVVFDTIADGIPGKRLSYSVEASLEDSTVNFKGQNSELPVAVKRYEPQPLPPDKVVYGEYLKIHSQNLAPYLCSEGAIKEQELQEALKNRDDTFNLFQPQIWCVGETDGSLDDILEEVLLAEEQIPDSLQYFVASRSPTDRRVIDLDEGITLGGAYLQGWIVSNPPYDGPSFLAYTTPIHEFGHALESSFGESIRNNVRSGFTGSDRYQSIFGEERYPAPLGGFCESTEICDTYGNTRAVEHFAVAFDYWVNPGTRPKLAAELPQTYAFVQERFEMIKNELALPATKPTQTATAKLGDYSAYPINPPLPEYEFCYGEYSYGRWTTPSCGDHFNRNLVGDEYNLLINGVTQVRFFNPEYPDRNRNFRGEYILVDHTIQGGRLSGITFRNLHGTVAGLENGLERFGLSGSLYYRNPMNGDAPLSPERRLDISHDRISVDEGEEVNFFVRLRSQPTEEVTITVTSSDLSEGTITPGVLKFTDSNWRTAQEVTLRGAEDNTIDGYAKYTIMFDVIGGGYDGQSEKMVAVTRDSDDPTFALSGYSLYRAERSSGDDKYPTFRRYDAPQGLRVDFLPNTSSGLADNSESILKSGSTRVRLINPFGDLETAYPDITTKEYLVVDHGIETDGRLAYLVLNNLDGTKPTEEREFTGGKVYEVQVYYKNP